MKMTSKQLTTHKRFTNPIELKKVKKKGMFTLKTLYDEMVGENAFLFSFPSVNFS